MKLWLWLCLTVMYCVEREKLRQSVYQKFRFGTGFRIIRED